MKKITNFKMASTEAEYVMRASMGVNRIAYYNGHIFE